MTEPIHIGEEIKRISDEQKVTAQQIGDVLGCHRNNVYRIFRTATIDTGDLAKICVLLKHDFFADYSKQIKPLLPSATAPIHIDINDRFLALEADVKKIMKALFDKALH